jgi:hypothetical protein
MGEEASSFVVLSSEFPVGGVLVVPIEVPARLARARVVVVPELRRWGTPEPLGVLLTGLLISLALLQMVAVFPYQSLLLHSDYTVHHVAKRWVIAARHDLVYPLVLPPMELELFLLIGVHVVGGTPHHLGEVALVFLHPHFFLVHDTKLLCLLDEHLAGDVLFPERLSELIPSDLSWACVGVAVAVPPGLCWFHQLVDCEGHALLVRAVGQVQLDLDDLQSINVHGVL